MGVITARSVASVVIVGKGPSGGGACEQSSDATVSHSHALLDPFRRTYFWGSTGSGSRAGAGDLG